MKEEKVKMKLEGLDGNAFLLLGAFSREARKQGFDGKYINGVINEAKKGDYNHLLATLIEHTEDTEEDMDDDNY